MPDLLIPRGFRKVAVSEDNVATVSCYHNPDRNKLFFCVKTFEGDQFSVGPLDRLALEMLMHCIKDVYELRGNYLYLDQ